MPLNARNTRNFTRVLYGGQANQTVHVYARGPDQQEGTVAKYKVFCCWREVITRTGQPIQGRQAAGNRCTWHLPAQELKKAGINSYAVLVRIYDPKTGDWWQPESDTTVTEQLFGTQVKVECKQVDPTPNLGG